MRGPVEVRFWRMVDKTSGQGPKGECWCWTGTKAGGYGQIGLGGRRGPRAYVHKLSYQMHRGLVPPGMMVCHSCDVRACVNPEHLFLGTALDNRRDCMAKGRHARGPLQSLRNRGVRNPSAKLSEDDVRAIRSDRRTLAEIAEQFAIAPSTAGYIKRRVRWSHLP